MFLLLFFFIFVASVWTTSEKQAHLIARGSRPEDSKGKAAYDIYLERKMVQSGSIALQQALSLKDKRNPKFISKIAHILKVSLETITPVNLESSDSLKVVKTILESRDPDIFMQFPDIFKELARMSDSADSIRRLFKYPNLFESRQHSSFFRSSHRPHLFANPTILRDIIHEIFMESKIKPLKDIETGKILIDFILEPMSSFGLYMGHANLKWALMWTCRYHLKDEFRRISDQLHYNYETGVLMFGYREAYEYQSLSILNELLTVERNYEDMFFHAWAIGDRDLMVRLFKTYYHRDPIVDKLWSNLKRDENNHINFQELLQDDLPTRVDPRKIVRYAMTFNHPELLRNLAERLGYAAVVLEIKAQLHRFGPTSPEVIVVAAPILRDYGESQPGSFIYEDIFTRALKFVSDTDSIKILLESFYPQRERSPSVLRKYHPKETHSRLITTMLQLLSDSGTPNDIKENIRKDIKDNFLEISSAATWTGDWRGLFAALPILTVDERNNLARTISFNAGDERYIAYNLEFVIERKIDLIAYLSPNFEDRLDAYVLLPSCYKFPFFKGIFVDNWLETKVFQYYLEEIKLRETEQDFQTFLKKLWMTWSSADEVSHRDSVVPQENKRPITRHLQKLLYYRRSPFYLHGMEATARLHWIKSFTSHFFN
jgi:hypothetical protein